MLVDMGDAVAVVVAVGFLILAVDVVVGVRVGMFMGVGDAVVAMLVS